MGFLWFAAGAAVGGYVGYKVGKAAGGGQPAPWDALRSQTAPASCVSCGASHALTGPAGCAICGSLRMQRPAGWSYADIQDPNVYDGDYEVVRPAG